MVLQLRRGERGGRLRGIFFSRLQGAILGACLFFGSEVVLLLKPKGTGL